MNQNGSIQAHGRTWPMYEREGYGTEISGTVPPGSVEAYRTELLALCARYGITPKVQPIMVLEMKPEDQAEKNRLDAEAAGLL